jgi:hypothetical protein
LIPRLIRTSEEVTLSLLGRDIKIKKEFGTGGIFTVDQNHLTRSRARSSRARLAGCSCDWTAGPGDHVCMFFCGRMADRPPELTPWGIEGIDQKGLNRRQQSGAQPTRIHRCPQPKAATIEDGRSWPSTYEFRFSLCAGSSLPNCSPADGLEGRVKIVVTISAPVANYPAGAALS